MDLFDFMREANMEKESPLAKRLRPTTLDEVVGQKHIIGKDKLLYRAIQADKISSVIFYGPPGTGKTTLAMVIANTTSSEFVQINATVSGKKDMEEVVEKSECICVLAPSNPEAHERLSTLALQSGKPLYIDKTFAPDRATAEKFFAIAEKYGTPLMSSSALRYGQELIDAMNTTFAEDKPCFVSTFGGGSTFQEYSIHQIEMIVATMGLGAKSVTRVNCSGCSHFQVDYADGVRGAAMTYGSFGFSSVLNGKSGSAFLLQGSQMFENLLDRILEFYTTGISPIDKAETIEVAAIREAALKADAEPGKTFAV